ncbi:hypothetical protein MJO29_007339 [Puccinia striiformis f. sp. tritici]|nr:hypothetical protein Pst134EB_014497 [Puccinia striiformis f. sp. tritici]KAI7955940.1 hypothetical protein MJO29_007339 [Puccinia striiformis f. sp. tritici]KAI9613231.1 hypothetical protein KEM48_003864 [Puccinia striiformis f. sp. tritici PST-130]
MGNNPSSHTQQQQQQHQQQQQQHSRASAPATPTGNHHHQQQQHQPTIIDSNLPPPTTTFIDGGYLFPLSNIYPSSPQDWLHPIVQQLILDRRLAPFYRGLEDWEPDWDRQTLAHTLQSITFSRVNSIKQIQKVERQESLEQPLTSTSVSKSASISKRFTKNLLLDHPSTQLSINQNHQNIDPQSAINLSHNVRQQIFEAVLNAQIRPNEIDQYIPQTVECPICFLYYPPNINLSRCCQQPICTECFTQIKRTDPTPQEIKSEPACCPYCVESNFGVTYEPPPLHKRTDWNSPASVSNSSTTTTDTLAVPVPTSLASSPPTNQDNISSQSAPNPSGMMNLEVGRTMMSDETESPKMKRRQTTSHTSKEVVTTDSIQVDWQSKLDAIKAVVQRRANRRIIFRQEGDRLIPVGITSSRDPNGSAFLAAFEQHSQHESASNPSTISRRGLSSLISGNHHSPTPSSHPTTTSTSTGSGSGGTVRRQRTTGGENSNNNYGVDLEELMIMEAMRLSLVEEEDRKKKAVEEEEKFKKISEAINDACCQPSTSTSPNNPRSLGDVLDSPSQGGTEQSASTSIQHSNTPATPTTPTPTRRLNAILSNPNTLSPVLITHQLSPSHHDHHDGGETHSPLTMNPNPLDDLRHQHQTIIDNHPLSDTDSSPVALVPSSAIPIHDSSDHHPLHVDNQVSSNISPSSSPDPITDSLSTTHQPSNPSHSSSSPINTTLAGSPTTTTPIDNPLLFTSDNHPPSSSNNPFIRNPSPPPPSDAHVHHDPDPLPSSS